MQHQPSVGRMVHYTSYGTPGREYDKECRAAIVTVADGDMVALAVMNPTGLFFNERIPYGRGGCGECDGGTWHWPDRV